MVSCEEADWGMDTSHTSAAGPHKRRRVTSGNDVSGLEPQALPLKSTADVMAMAGLTASQLDACSVRCGIGDLKPVRFAVQNILRGTFMRFRGIVPTSSLRVCFERAIATIDGLLVGFTRTFRSCTNHLLSDNIPAVSSADTGLPPQMIVALLWVTATQRHVANQTHALS